MEAAVGVRSEESPTCIFSVFSSFLGMSWGHG